MSRRRYISTAISVDKRVAKLSDSAALLWTWMIPHAEEDATITGDIEELRWTVVPSRPQMNIESCLCEIEGQRLIVRRGATIYFDSEAFYRYQSNIHQDKRADHSARFTNDERETAENSGEQRETAENSASLSLSFSPSFKRSRALVDASAPTGEHIDANFTEWWGCYGKIGSKADARMLYEWWLTNGAVVGELRSAAVHYRRHCQSTDTKMAHARTFLAKKPNRWREWADGELHGSMDVTNDDDLAAVLRAGAQTYGGNDGGHNAVCESNEPARFAGRS
jgi:hypothetical protein